MNLLQHYIACGKRHNGISIGEGITTKVPILISSQQGSVLFSGHTGSSKSHVLRLTTKRFSHINPTASIFIVDPKTEDFIDIAEDCRLAVIPTKDGVPKFGDRFLFADEFHDDKVYERNERLTNLLKQIWDRIIELPKEQLKLVVFDEIFTIANTKKGKELLDTFRLSRKLNVLFIASIQHQDQTDMDLIKLFGNQVFMSQVGDAVKTFGITDTERIKDLEREDVDSC